MNVVPLARSKFRPVALLFPGHRHLIAYTSDERYEVHGRRNVEALLGKLSTHMVYVPSGLAALRHTTGALVVDDAHLEESPGPYVELFARQPRLGWDAWGHGYEIGASMPVADERTEP